LPPDTAEFQLPAAADEAAPLLETAPNFRCTYLGKWGSFHLIGSRGTAGYKFNGNKYLADLAFSRETEEYYYYKQTGHGDPAISLWAFAKFPASPEKYEVWRRTTKGWRRYECAERWGENLNSAVPVAATDTDILNRLDAVERTVEKHEQILNPSAPNSQGPR
jgi:hypothetical protein